MTERWQKKHQKVATLMVAGVIGCGAISASPAIAQSVAQPTQFLEWCQRRGEFSLDTQKVIQLMLDRVQTQNCSEAAPRVAAIGNMNLASQGITDISPLASATNLRSLEIFNNQISDLSPLSALTNLTQLRAGYNPISDVSPLARLENLQLLGLTRAQISDISLLNGLTNLTELRLGENKISDIEPLSSLTNLSHLDLKRNLIADIAPLEPLKNLVTLDLSFNQIRRTNNVLDSLPNLKEIDLTGNPLPATSCRFGPNTLCLPPRRR